MFLSLYVCMQTCEARWGHCCPAILYSVLKTVSLRIWSSPVQVDCLVIKPWALSSAQCFCYSRHGATVYYHLDFFKVVRSVELWSSHLQSKCSYLLHHAPTLLSVHYSFILPVVIWCSVHMHAYHVFLIKSFITGHTLLSYFVHCE